MKLRIRNKLSFWSGIFLGIFLFISYFVKIQIGSGANYVIKSSLLSILIFRSPFVLAIYGIIVLGLVVFGLMKIKIE